MRAAMKRRSLPATCSACTCATRTGTASAPRWHDLHETGIGGVKEAIVEIFGEARSAASSSRAGPIASSASRRPNRPAASTLRPRPWSSCPRPRRPTSRSTRTATSASRSSAPRGPAARASTRPTRPSGSRAFPAASSWRSRTSEASSKQGQGDGDPARPAPGPGAVPAARGGLDDAPLARSGPAIDRTRSGPTTSRRTGSPITASAWTSRTCPACSTATWTGCWRRSAPPTRPSGSPPWPSSDGGRS